MTISWNAAGFWALPWRRGHSRGGMEMKKLAFAAATVAALALSAPAFAFDGAAAPRMQLAQADVKVKIKTGDHGMVKKKVVIRHGDRGLHHGWHGNRGRHH